MKQLLFATGNPSKVKRFKDKLLKYDIELLCLKDINLNVDVDENGSTAIENALIKARAYADKVNMPVLAMDDTLYIENIPDDLQPGLYVRRVNGKSLTDEEALDYYSSLAHKYGDDGKLTCRWVYGMSLINNDKENTYTWSKEDFYLVDKRSDIINPGYPLNSISVNKKLNKYFTDMTDEDKESLKEDESHVIDFIINSI